MPTVSVIIPCYNQGEFLPEAVESVLAQTFDDLEIVIVNDGSTDRTTVESFNSYDDPKIIVLNTSNQGLAAARNSGIESASGTYILPLDADDKIGSSYLREAVAFIEKHSDVGIVYCNAQLFGAVEGDWQLPEYRLDEMLRDNIIFCTALFRKRDWQKVGGYDPAMVYGWEDYDFWLSLIESGLQVHRLEGRHFFYRVNSDSMVRSTAKDQKVEMFKRIYHRHQKLFSDHIEAWIEPLLETREPYLTSRLYVDCGDGLSDDSSIARKIEPGRHIIRFPLSSYHHIKTLRFDPADQPVIVELIDVELVTDSEIKTIAVQDTPSNAIMSDGNRYMFSTDDSQLYPFIEERMLRSARELSITIDLIAHGTEALKQIIEALHRKHNGGNTSPSLLKWLGCRK